MSTSQSSEPRPVVIPPDIAALARFAESLPEQRVWVVWRHELIKNRWSKVPYNPWTGAHAETDNPATWVTFEQAAEGYRRGNFDGVGVCRHQDLVFVDLDTCCDPETGTLTPWAEDFIRAIEGRAYLEKSVSGKGIHAFVRGTLPPGRRKWQPPNSGDHEGIEVFSAARYFTATGCALPESGAITDLTPELAALHAKLFTHTNGNGASPPPPAITSGESTEGIGPHEVRAYLAARGVKLNLVGGEFRGCCPIHSGKRDSFAMSPETGRWFCHSECKRGGDLFDFERALSGTSFPERRRRSSRRSGERSLLPATTKSSRPTTTWTNRGRCSFRCAAWNPRVSGSAAPMARAASSGA